MNEKKCICKFIGKGEGVLMDEASYYEVNENCVIHGHGNNFKLKEVPNGN